MKNSSIVISLIAISMISQSCGGGSGSSGNPPPTTQMQTNCILNGYNATQDGSCKIHGTTSAYDTNGSNLHFTVFHNGSPAAYDVVTIVTDVNGKIYFDNDTSHGATTVHLDYRGQGDVPWHMFNGATGTVTVKMSSTLLGNDSSANAQAYKDSFITFTIL